MPATTRPEMSVSNAVVYVAFELAKREWKLALTVSFGVAPLLRTVASGDWAGVDRAVAAARGRWGVPTTASVVSCYEAGRDGFWVHRALTARGIKNRVVDSASIEVNRRAKRAKTDRLDAVKLVTMLVRAVAGEPTVWREVHVPSEAAEAARHRSRDRAALVKDRTALINQMRGWLATVGTTLPKRARAEWWTTVTDAAGAALPSELQARLARAAARLALLATQIAALDAEVRAAVREAAPQTAVARLVQLKGIGAGGASVLLDEGLEWREFENRRQVGGVLGFTPMPFASGGRAFEQGISRAGNARLQATMTQLAWQWIRWQPDSPITQWFHARFGSGARARKIGIVAVARKLLIVLWRWATKGIAPMGARYQAA